METKGQYKINDKSREKKFISLRLDADLLEAIESYGYEHRMSRSQVVVIAINEFVKRLEKRNN